MSDIYREKCPSPSRAILTACSVLAACAAVLILLWLLPGGLSAHAAPAELHVCPSECTYSSLQVAVDEANPGDVIRVAAGTYTDIHARAGVTQVVYISKTVTIQGGYTTAFTEPPNPEINQTTLNAQEQGRVIFVAGSINPTIEGLRITGGDATGLGGGRFGEDAGGGVYVIDATAVISNNQVFSNSAPDQGGGVYLRNGVPALNGNTIVSNTAYSGGGVALYSSGATLNGNTVASNIASYGGGLYLMVSDATLNRNTIVSNTAEWRGGGVYLAYGDATISGSTIISNASDRQGGGLDIYESDVTLTNNVVADNHANIAGSALYLRRTFLSLLHTTIARNSGGDGSGIYVASWQGVYNTVALTNTILVSHTVGITVTAGNTATLEGTLWGSDSWANGTDWGGDGNIFTGTVNVWGDPAFVNPDGGDYHIGRGSAALDAGVDAGVTADIDGDPRPIGSKPDLGADEAAWRRVFLPLVVRDY
ncbi:MAG: hypothetical protein JXA14_16940 [Anaerolineae bacterium]|nr:hypothetical protein [Anaerolineae bacterium]